jgi:hypothetical protein
LGHGDSFAIRPFQGRDGMFDSRAVGVAHGYLIRPLRGR